MRNFLLLLMASLSLNVFASVHADFSADKYSGCPPLLVNFRNASAPSDLSWSWDFGNGNTSSLANPSAVFNSAGKYHVMLVITNGTQVDSIEKLITVFALPRVNFHTPQVTICEGDTAHLFNDVIPGDGSIIDFAWGLGNGVAQSGPNTNYIYNHPGNYDLTLVVQDSNNCTSSLTKTSYIKVFANPRADFTASPAASCNATQLVSFTNTSTGTGLTYFWRLNDSTTSTLANPQQTYHQERTMVWMTATNAAGCRSTSGHWISAAEVHADFYASKTEVCAGETMQFINTSNLYGARSWDFGDGTPINQSWCPFHSYAEPGIYTVSLVSWFNGCNDSISKIAYIKVNAGFNVSFSTDVPNSGCDSAASINFTNTTPDGAQFLWNFGDGNYSSDENPSHTYNSNGIYTIRFTVTSSDGCVSTGSGQTLVSIYTPEPDFEMNMQSCPGVPVRFTNLTSGGVNFLWQFGDGDTSTLKNPSHTYSELGNYSVSLKVVNNNGCSGTIVKPNSVLVDTVHADFRVNQTFSPCPPFVAIFTSNSNKSNLKYFWDFGDNRTDTAENPTHIYFHPGIFNVRLIVSTPGGCTDTVVYPGLIEVQGPTGIFSEVSSTGCIPLKVAFHSTISPLTKMIQCDLGDGTLISDSLDFEHTYTEVNTFIPRFILTDHVGCSVPFDLPSIVTHELPVLELRDTLICQGREVAVNLGNDSYRWIPATFLSCDTCAKVKIVPQSTVSYEITATTPFGCKVSDTMTVFSEAIPVLVPPAIVKVCENSPVQLFVGDAYDVRWSPSTFLNDSAVAKPICTPASSMVYEVTASNKLGCSVSTQVPIETIEKLELLPIPDQTICAFADVQLNASIQTAPDTGVSFIWLPGNMSVSAENPNHAIIGLSRTTVFQVIASSGTCIADTEFVTVHVIDGPEMEVSEKMSVSPLAEVELYASSREDLQYHWSSNDSISCVDCRRTTVYPSESQYVYVTGTNSWGCRVTDSVRIEVSKCDPNAIFAANTFTPNNDGLNDKFLVRSNVLSRLNYLRIFDQWGGIVFETKNMNEGWDGTIKGQPAPVAVYVFTLGGTCDNGFDVTKSSNITLVR